MKHIKDFNLNEDVQDVDELSDEKNPIYIFNTTHTSLLVKAIKGEIDLFELAKKQLANRGVDENGFWVGFDTAKKIHGV